MSNKFQCTFYKFDTNKKSSLPIILAYSPVKKIFSFKKDTVGARKHDAATYHFSHYAAYRPDINCNKASGKCVVIQNILHAA